LAKEITGFNASALRIRAKGTPSGNAIADMFFKSYSRARHLKDRPIGGDGTLSLKTEFVIHDTDTCTGLQMPCGFDKIDFVNKNLRRLARAAVPVEGGCASRT